MNLVCRICAKIAISQTFMLITTFFILANTMVLAFDRYPISNSEQKLLELLNMIFSAFFLIEMLIKMLGLGLRSYARDRMNLFDAFIVTVSIAEELLKLAIGGGSNLSVIAGFRSLRIFRIFKLARSWTNLRNLLYAMTLSFAGIVHFSILVTLFLVVTSLLGEEFYAYRIRFIDGDRIAPIPSLGSSPRVNFDNFYNGVIAIFIILTNEDWNNIMIQHIRGSGSLLSLVYFVFVVIIGNFILLKLFLAILINNFADAQLKVKQ